MLNIELFEWWNEFIEIPSVVEGVSGQKSFDMFRKHADYVMIDSDIWDKDTENIVNFLKLA